MKNEKRLTVVLSSNGSSSVFLPDGEYHESQAKIKNIYALYFEHLHSLGINIEEVDLQVLLPKGWKSIVPHFVNGRVVAVQVKELKNI